MNPFERCAVCGYRRYTHWLMFMRTFYTDASLIEAPKRPWFL